MIAPGSRRDLAGKILVKIASTDTGVDHFNNGNPFNDEDKIVLCSAAPGTFGNAFMNSICRTNKGAIYGTNVLLASDVYSGGLRISRLGQVVYTEIASPSRFSNGNPQSNLGVLCVGNEF